MLARHRTSRLVTMMPMSEPVQVPSRREEACPGCGALLPVENGPTHPYMRSSPACWARYGEVLAREFGDPAYFASGSVR